MLRHTAAIRLAVKVKGKQSKKAVQKLYSENEEKTKWEGDLHRRGFEYAVATATVWK